jgi:hypothetical protein
MKGSLIEGFTSSPVRLKFGRYKFDLVGLAVVESVCPIRGAAKLPKDYTRSIRLEMAMGADFRRIHNLEPGLVPDGQSAEEIGLGVVTGLSGKISHRLSVSGIFLSYRLSLLV